MPIGDKTFFWKDKWCGDVPLKDVCPNLYEVENRKNCFLIDKAVFDNGMVTHWRWEWMRQLRRGRETDQL